MLRKLKARLERLRARVKRAKRAQAGLKGVRVPKGARPLRKRLGERLRALRKKANERVRKIKRRLKRIRRERNKRIDTTPGHPHWGGSRAIIEREVLPVAQQFGVPVTSTKRPVSHPLSISNPGSDHNEANTLAYAVDLGTYSGQALAHAIAKALGISNYTTGTYTAHYIVRDGRTYRVQILWGVSGHWDHVHVGMKRIS